METREEIKNKKNLEQKKLIKESLENDFKAVLSALGKLDESMPTKMTEDQLQAFKVINKNILVGNKEVEKKDKTMLIIAALTISNLVMLFYIIFSSF